MIMKNSLITQVEDYVGSLPTTEYGHDWGHFDRVRRWALKIARSEGYANLSLVETAALLHDIGLTDMENRGGHGRRGADMAEHFLKRHCLFGDEEIQEICDSIRLHTTKQKLVSPLAGIIRDADIIDLLGAVGIVRGIQSRAFLPVYDPADIKGKAYRVKNDFFDDFFARGVMPANYITDQISFQASCLDNITTESAREIALPLVRRMQKFLDMLCEAIVALN